MHISETVYPCHPRQRKGSNIDVVAFVDIVVCITPYKIQPYYFSRVVPPSLFYVLTLSILQIVSGGMFMEFFCRALHRGRMTLAIGDNIQNDAKRYMGITGMVHYNGQPATTETLPGKWAYYLDIPRWQFVTCQRFGAQWKNCATETPLFLKVAGVEQIQFWFWEYFDKTISKKVSKIHVFLLWRNGPMDSDQKFKFKFEGFVDHAKMKIDPLFVQVRRTTKSNIKEAFGTDKFISSWSSFLRLKEKEKKKSEISKMLHQYVFDEFDDTAMVPGEESDLPVLQEESIKESMVMANPYANGEMILHD